MKTKKEFKINKIKKALEKTGCICKIEEGKLVITCENSTLTVKELLQLLGGFKLITDLDFESIKP